jgi:hypothetical protein
MPTTLPLVMDPAQIPHDIWNMMFDNPGAVVQTGWADTVMGALADHKLPDFVTERIKRDMPFWAFNVLENPHHPELVKPFLAHNAGEPGSDLSQDAAWKLRKQTNLPADTVQWMYDHYDKGLNVLGVLAEQIHAPVHILNDLAKLPYSGIHEALANNPSTPHDAKITMLAQPTVHREVHDRLVNEASEADIDSAIDRADSLRSDGPEQHRKRGSYKSGSNVVKLMMLRGHGNKVSDKLKDRWATEEAADGDNEAYHFEDMPDMKLTDKQAQILHDANGYNRAAIHQWLASNSGTPESVLNRIATASPDMHARVQAVTRQGPESMLKLWTDHMLDHQWAWPMRRVFSDPKTNTPGSILEQMFISNNDPEVREFLLAHPNMTHDNTLRIMNIVPDATNDVAASGKMDSRHVQLIMDRHPQDIYTVGKDLSHIAGAATPEQWKEITHRVKTFAPDPDFVKYYERAGIEAGHADTPDPKVDVRFGTNRIRGVRTLVDQAGGQLHESQLAQQGINLRQMGHGKLISPQGVVTSQAISDHIDSLPSLRYGISDDMWNGAQRHDRDRAQHVLQVNASSGHLREISKAGLLSLYKDMLDNSHGHPVHKERGFGWVRYSPGEDGNVHIDEIQTDFHEGGAMYRHAKKKNPEKAAKMKQLFKIMWGSKNPNDVLHEVFHQAGRNQGRHGTKVHMWTLEPKMDLAQMDPSEKPPVHAVNTYKNYPEKMGYEPASYGETDAQSNHALVGKPTQKITLHKKEALQKMAVSPKDTKGIARQHTDKGQDIVEHTHDLAHGGKEESRNSFKHHVIDPQEVVPRANARVTGTSNASAKTLWKTPAGTFMAKPYHERPAGNQKWVKYPIQGWAEMTNQALYHAGGIGHLHQDVHVASIPLEQKPRIPGVPASHRAGTVSEQPALIVKWAEGAIPFDGTDHGNRLDFRNMSPKVRAQGRQMAIMDFLTGNLDRHKGNLLYHRDTDSLHAVDHSRSFQYQQNYKFIPNTMMRPDEDTLGNYMGRNSALGELELFPHRASRGEPDYWNRVDQSNQDWGETFQWWADNASQIKKAMYQRLALIKNPEIRNHIANNFEHRARHLDQMADFGHENFGHDDWHHSTIEMERPPRVPTKLLRSEPDIDGWLKAQGAPLQKSVSGNEAYKAIIYRWELPVKVMLGDTHDFPEFRAAHLLAPNRRFNETMYREAMRLYGDDMVMAAIFAYDLPRTQDTVRQIETLMEMYE